MTDNPWVHPKHQSHRRRKEGPLDPTTHPGWYIDDVGNHDECFVAFRAVSVTALLSKGRLVVVEGPPRSGKTSLINRCRHFLAEQASAVESEQLQIWSCDQSQLSTTKTLSDDSEQLLPAPILRRDVCRAAVVEAGDWLEPVRARAEELLREPEANNVQLVYKLIGQRLGPDRLAEMVLPKVTLDSDLARNLEVYDRLAVPQMIFFAERTTTPNSPPLIPEPATAGRDETLILRLHNLTVDETRSIVAHRLGNGPRTEQRPGVEDEVFQELADLKNDGPDSIGYIVELFRALYEKRISGGARYSHLVSIGWAEVTDHLVREAP